MTKALQIDLDLNREDYAISDVLWLEDGPDVEYVCTPRIGIDSASEEDRGRLWRFFTKTFQTPGLPSQGRVVSGLPFHR